MSGGSGGYADLGEESGGREVTTLEILTVSGVPVTDEILTAMRIQRSQSSAAAEALRRIESDSSSKTPAGEEFDSLPWEDIVLDPFELSRDRHERLRTEWKKRRDHLRSLQTRAAIPSTTRRERSSTAGDRQSWTDDYVEEAERIEHASAVHSYNPSVGQRGDVRPWDF